MTRAESRLQGIVADYQRRTVTNCKGVEQIFLMELVRGLDEAAYAFMLAPNRDELRRDDHARHRMLRGAAMGLSPLLRQVRGLPGPIPLVPTNQRLASIADEYLINCGTLTELSRIAAFERYGLSQATFTSPEHLLLEVTGGAEERHDVESLRYLKALVQDGRSGVESALLSMTPDIHRRLDQYVRVDRDEFIAYDNDEELVGYYEALAALRATDFFESEALPPNAVIGGRTFSNWCNRAVAASGRVHQHAAFACRLKALHPRLDLRNLLYRSTRGKRT